MLLMLMIVLQIVNHLSINTKIVGKTPERAPQSGNLEDTNQAAHPSVPSLNVVVTIPLKFY